VSKVLTQEYRSFDDGLIIGWTYTISALPGGITPPTGDWVKTSSSSSVSSSGPVETATFMLKSIYEIRRRIIVSTQGQAGAYADLQASLPPLLKPKIYGFNVAWNKLSKNAMKPRELLSAFGFTANQSLGSNFTCVLALADMSVLTQQNFNFLTQYENFSLDMLFRTLYSGMGLKIVFSKDGQAKLKDITNQLSVANSISIPGSDIMSHSHSLDNSQVPSSFTTSIDANGKLTTKQASPTTSAVQRDAMVNRSTVMRDQYSHLSTSLMPAKAIDFGLFKYVNILAIGSSNVTINGGVAKIKVGNCIDGTITLSKRDNKLSDDFSRAVPVSGDYDLGPVHNLIMSTVSALFRSTSMYESMSRASNGVVVFRGVGIVSPWQKITIGATSIQSAKVGAISPVTLTTTASATHLVTSVEEITEAGIPRTVAHFAKLDI